MKTSAKYFGLAIGLYAR